MNHFLPKCNHIPCIQCLIYKKGLCRPQPQRGTAIEEAACEWEGCVCAHPYHATAPCCSFTSKARRGWGWTVACLFSGLCVSTLAGSALEKGFQSQWLINSTEIYLPALTKLIVISTFVPSFLLLMNGHVLGESVITVLDISL